MLQLVALAASTLAIGSLPVVQPEATLRGGVTRRMPAGRPAPTERTFQSAVVDAAIDDISSRMKDPDLATLFSNTLPNTLDTTVKFSVDAETGLPDTFVITGDINAMWLRDSTNQVWPYMRFIDEDPAIREMIEGVVRRQTAQVLLDPWANAFNPNSEGSYWDSDSTTKPGFLGVRLKGMRAELHERKYELDSLCAVIRLAHGYHQATNDTSILNDSWVRAMRSILSVVSAMQAATEDQDASPPYTFQRETRAPTDTLLHGVGHPAKYTGMSRSPFRPSDDASTFPFLVPANAYAVVSLRQLSELALIAGQVELSNEALSIAQEIDNGIQAEKCTHRVFGEIYGYEVDGYGNCYFADDANVPSLLSLPYLGYSQPDDPLYQRTRSFVLSSSNPWYSEGAGGKGIGSPHVKHGWIWPMSVIMQAMTSSSDAEISECLEIIKASSANTGFLHESYWKDDPSSFSRPWFAWVNGLFGELILKISDERPHLIF